MRISLPTIRPEPFMRSRNLASGMGETYLIDVEITPDDEVSRVARGNFFLKRIG